MKKLTLEQFNDLSIEDIDYKIHSACMTGASGTGEFTLLDLPSNTDLKIKFIWGTYEDQIVMSDFELVEFVITDEYTCVDLDNKLSGNCLEHDLISEVKEMALVA